MAIDPRIGGTPGDFPGVAMRLSDLDRRLRNVESMAGRTASVNGSLIAPGSITGSQIAVDTLTATNIAANAITASEIAAGSIYAGALQAGSVVAGNIAANAVTATTIAANSINAGHIVANAITAAQIAANTITAAQIASGTITSTQIQAGSITAGSLSVSTLSSITTNMGSITAGTITGGTFQTAASGSRVVLDSAGIRGYALDGVTKVFEVNSGSGIASFTGVANIDPASVIPGGTITTNTLPGDRIVAGSVTATQIAAGSITTNLIQAGAVTTSKLTLDWGGSNILWDSGFEDTTSSPGMWTTLGANATRTSTSIVPVSGQNVMKLQATAPGSIYFYSNNSSPSVGVDPNTGQGPYGPTNSYPGFYPLLKGKNYTFSIYIASPTTARDAVVQLNWYDALFRTALPAPTSPTATGTTGGSLTPSTTYNYKVTAINANGETVATSQFSVALTSGQNAATIQAQMPSDATGTDYPVTAWRIYRSTTATFAGYIQQAAVGGALVSYTDTGAALTGAAAPPVTGTAQTVQTLATVGNTFTTVIPSSTYSPPGVTGPTVVTGPLVPTGALAGKLWSTWVRPYVTAQVPLGAAFATPILTIQNAANTEIHYLDAAQLERGDIPTGYARRTGEVLPGEVGATQITPNSITSNQIKASSITAASIGVTSLSAISAELGSVNIGTGTAVLFTGGKIRTAASGARIEQDASGLYAYNSGGTQTFALSSSTGIVSSIGTISTGLSGAARGTLSSTALQGYNSSNALTMQLSYSGSLGFYNGTSGQIFWNDPGTAQDRARLLLTGYNVGYNQVESQAVTGAGNTKTLATLTAVNGNTVSGSNYASHYAQWDGTRYSAGVVAGSQSATILNSDNNSVFLRYNSPGTVANYQLGKCTISASAGVTGFNGFSYTFVMSGSAVVAGATQFAWITSTTQDARIQWQVYGNGFGNSVTAWFYNGTGATQSITGELYVIGW
jgi:hypothetical protein